MVLDQTMTEEIVPQVDEVGEVVRNAWEDCQAGCPVEEAKIN